MFDLDEFLVFLEDLGALDVVTIPIPPEINFCEDMVIASVKSMRHMRAIHDELLWMVSIQCMLSIFMIRHCSGDFFTHR